MTNLNHTQNRESIRKPYARKQRGFHNTTSTEILMMSKTAWFRKSLYMSDHMKTGIHTSVNG